MRVLHHVVGYVHTHTHTYTHRHTHTPFGGAALVGGGGGGTTRLCVSVCKCVCVCVCVCVYERSRIFTIFTHLAWWFAVEVEVRCIGGMCVRACVRSYLYEVYVWCLHVYVVDTHPHVCACVRAHTPRVVVGSCS